MLSFSYCSTISRTPSHFHSLQMFPAICNVNYNAYINRQDYNFFLMCHGSCSKSGRTIDKQQIFMINSRLTIKVLATLQPSVPAPSSRHLADTIFSKSRVGTNRQHINFKLRSTDDSANLYHKINSNTDEYYGVLLFFFFFFPKQSKDLFQQFGFFFFPKRKERSGIDHSLKAHASSSPNTFSFSP